jgi:hypothetical protein
MAAQLKLAVKWAFDSAIHDQEGARLALRPGVAKWANAAYPLLKANLRRDPKSGANCATDVFQVNVTSTPLWVFVAMIVNRDIGDDMCVMVAADEPTIDIMADSFLQAMNARMGPSTEASRPN